jgi:hypothetical protein
MLLGCIVLSFVRWLTRHLNSQSAGRHIAQKGQGCSLKLSYQMIPIMNTIYDTIYIRLARSARAVAVALFRVK